MKRRLLFTLLLAGLATGACHKKEPPAQPTPTVNEDSLRAAREAEARAAAERARADSIARAEAEARAAAEAAVRETREVLTQRVHFDYDQYDIRSDAADLLRRKVDALQANPDVRLRIVGHADERGSVEYNLALGLRRANAVRDFLAGFNLDPSRFTVETRGEEEPLDTSGTEAAFAMNRRAEFQITAGGDNLRPAGR